MVEIMLKGRRLLGQCSPLHELWCKQTGCYRLGENHSHRLCNVDIDLHEYHLSGCKWVGNYVHAGDKIDYFKLDKLSKILHAI